MGKGEASTPPGRGGLEKLILLEWELIGRLKELAYATEDERARVQYYLNLSSHARTLAYLIGQCGGGGKEGQDLADLLMQISREARKFVRGMRRGKVVAAAQG